LCAGDVCGVVTKEAPGFADALTGCEAVIHLVGIISEVGRSTFEKVHTWGTGNMVRAAQLAGVKRFIHMSALGTRPNAASRYHQTKWAAEEAVRQSGLDHTIFRPSLIYGPRDQFVNVFSKIIRLSPIVPVFGSPTAKFQPVSVAAVATAFVRALIAPKAIGQTYDLCGPETFTLPQIIDQIMQVIGRRRLKLHIPGTLARCQAALLEFIFPRLPHPKAPPLNRDQLTMLHEDNVGEARPANDLFGLQHPQFRDGIARYLKAGGPPTNP
jgi:NADH dehydrogenase